MVGNIKHLYSDEFEADPVTISMEISSLAKKIPSNNLKVSDTILENDNENQKELESNPRKPTTLLAI